MTQESTSPANAPAFRLGVGATTSDMTAVLELRDAYAALPESVSGDAAPEGATLGDRIKALTVERDHERAARQHCHFRHMLIEEAAGKACRDYTTGAPASVRDLAGLLYLGYRAIPGAQSGLRPQVGSELVDAFMENVAAISPVLGRLADAEPAIRATLGAALGRVVPLISTAPDRRRAMIEAINDHDARLDETAREGKQRVATREGMRLALAAYDERTTATRNDGAPRTGGNGG